MAKKVINPIHETIEVEELGLGSTITRLPYDIKVQKVSKSDLQTPITGERLHASKPWNKTRTKTKNKK